MTKQPRTFVLRYIPCGCKVREGCGRCNHTGYRTEHVPLADAILEVEEQNAAAYLESVKQDTAKQKAILGTILGKVTGGAPCISCSCTDFHIPYRASPIRCAECDTPYAAEAHSPTVGKRPTCPDCGQGLHWLQTKSQAYCGRCGHTVSVTSGERALLTPHSARQSGAQVDDTPSPDAGPDTDGDASPDCPECGWPSCPHAKPDCVHCGWPSQNPAIVKRIGPCKECGHNKFYYPGPHSGLKCCQYGTKVP